MAVTLGSPALTFMINTLGPEVIVPLKALLRSRISTEVRSLND